MERDALQPPHLSAPPASMVLYCLVREMPPGAKEARFLMLEKHGSLTFPPTKLRPGESLYQAMVRPLEQDLGLPADSYFPEEELPVIPNHVDSPAYPGLTGNWYLYPVDVSLNDPGREALRGRPEAVWLTLSELLDTPREPNVRKLAETLRYQHPQLLESAHAGPSMEALACAWASRNDHGVRTVRGEELRSILGAGSRAFNLRVADPYLPYQRQGYGFTWSFFTPKDRQDIHVHGLPAVEIYGVLAGTLQVWHKPMNQRGARVWACETLGPSDWIEVEPLNCHFACWSGSEGLGVVIKASGGGELAGVGKLGISGKTTCKDCNVARQCAKHPRLEELAALCAEEYDKRDLARIAQLINEHGEA